MASCCIVVVHLLSMLIFAWQLVSCFGVPLEVDTQKAIHARNNSDDDDSQRTILYIVIVVISCLIIILCIALIFIWCCKSARKQPEEVSSVNSSTHNPKSTTTPASSTLPNLANKFSLKPAMSSTVDASASSAVAHHNTLGGSELDIKTVNSSEANIDDMEKQFKLVERFRRGKLSASIVATKPNVNLGPDKNEAKKSQESKQLIQCTETLSGQLQKRPSNENKQKTTEQQASKQKPLR